MAHRRKTWNMERRSVAKVLDLEDLSEQAIYIVVEIDQHSPTELNDYNYIVLVQNRCNGKQFKMYMSFYDIQIAKPGLEFTVCGEKISSKCYMRDISWIKN